MSSLSPSSFMTKVRNGEVIIPPVDVKGFEPGHLPGYTTFESGTYKIDDPKYGAVGSKHLRPRVLGANPWKLSMGTGVLLENYNPDRYKINIGITTGASGHVVISGEWSCATVIRDNKGNRVFGNWVNLDTRIEFDVGGGTPTPPPTDPAAPFSVDAPRGEFVRPVYGGNKVKIGYMTMSPTITGATSIVSPANPGIERTKTGTNQWTVYITSGALLGKFKVGVKAKVNGKDVAILADADCDGGCGCSGKCGIEIISAGSLPVDPPKPPDYPDIPLPPPPSPPSEPDPEDEIVLLKSSTETTVLGDADGNVEWSVIATTDENGEGRIEGEALPRRMVTDYLPAPKIFRPVQRRSIKRSFTVEDTASIEALGEQEKRVRFAGVDSWGAIQQYAEAALIDAARCVRGTASIPCNPLLRAGDIVLYREHEWHVEHAQHNLAEWTTNLTMRRVPAGTEIAGVFFSSPGNAETAIVRVVKDATGRVNNAVEGTIVQQVDARTYLVKVRNSDEIVAVRSDHVIFGDLIVGGTILIGRGTK